jgi:hypothetical protein
MPKRIALKDFVSVDSVDLSNLSRNVTFSSEDAEVDVSGFSASGANEYLPGPRTQSVTVEFFGSYGTGEVHQTLWPIYRDREVVEFAWRPDQTAPISADNPSLQGNVNMYTYASPTATRGDVDVFTATFRAADDAGFDFVTTPTPG